MRVPGVKRISGRRWRRRLLAGLALAVAAAVVIVVVLNAGSSSPSAASNASKTSGADRSRAPQPGRDRHRVRDAQLQQAADRLQPPQRNDHMAPAGRPGDQAGPDAVQGRRRAGAPDERDDARVPRPQLVRQRRRRHRAAQPKPGPARLQCGRDHGRRRLAGRHHRRRRLAPGVARGDRDRHPLARRDRVPSR